MQKFSNLGCWFIAIHYGHVAIHKYKVKATKCINVVLDIVYDNIQSFLPIDSKNTLIFNIFKPNWIHDDLQCHSIELLVINDQYLLLSTHFILNEWFIFINWKIALSNLIYFIFYIDDFVFCSLIILIIEFLNHNFLIFIFTLIF